MKKEKYLAMTRLAHMAVLSAVAVLLMFFEFSLPMIAPGFYKIDFSEIPVLMGGFLWGPSAAIGIEACKIVLYLLLRGTQTAFVGEISNFLLGCAFVLPMVYGYRFYKKKPLWIFALFSVISLAFWGFLLNLWILIPAYVSIANFPLEAILEAGKAIFPSISSLSHFVLLCATPFNIIKGSILAIFFLLTQKRFQNFYRYHQK